MYIGDGTRQLFSSCILQDWSAVAYLGAEKMEGHKPFFPEKWKAKKSHNENVVNAWHL